MTVVSFPKLSKESQPVQLLGRVLEQHGGGQFGVADEEGTVWTCRRAASCLLKPETGDTVLLCGPDRLHVYLIAVIEQADASASRIEAAGELTLGSADEGGVAIVSATELRLDSGNRLVLKAAQGECDFGQLQLNAQSADAAVGHLRLVGKVFETMADRVVQMARNVLRLVDDTERVRAGHFDQEVTHTLRMHGRDTMVTAKNVVKVDASQIHMG